MAIAMKTCTCKHEFQDRTYGHGIRVHNESVKGFICTVCGAEKITLKVKEEEKKN